MGVAAGTEDYSGLQVMLKMLRVAATDAVAFWSCKLGVYYAEQSVFCLSCFIICGVFVLLCIVHCSVSLCILVCTTACNSL